MRVLLSALAAIIAPAIDFAGSPLPAACAAYPSVVAAMRATKLYNGPYTRHQAHAPEFVVLRLAHLLSQPRPSVCAFARAVPDYTIFYGMLCPSRGVRMCTW